MSQTYYKIWVHVIWSTKNRQPLLQKEIRQKVLNHIREKSQTERIYLDAVSGMPDHIHCLISVNPKYSISEIINKIKGESSHWINHQRLLNIQFAWQNGYSAFSVSESQIEKTREYINNQENHHKKLSFIEEVDKLLKLHNIRNSIDAKETKG